MKNLNQIAEKIADQIHVVEESEIHQIIVKASEENNVDFSKLYRMSQNAYYEKYERGGIKVSPEAVMELNCNAR